MARLLEDYFMATDGNGGEPELIERDIVPTVYVSGATAEARGPIIRFVFWDEVTRGENRVVDRIAMPRDVAHGLMAQLQTMFPVDR